MEVGGEKGNIVINNNITRWRHRLPATLTFSSANSLLISLQLYVIYKARNCRDIFSFISRLNSSLFILKRSQATLYLAINSITLSFRGSIVNY